MVKVSIVKRLTCIANYWEEEDKKGVTGEIAMQRPSSFHAPATHATDMHVPHGYAYAAPRLVHNLYSK